VKFLIKPVDHLPLILGIRLANTTCAIATASSMQNLEVHNQIERELRLTDQNAI